MAVASAEVFISRLKTENQPVSSINKALNSDWNETHKLCLIEDYVGSTSYKSKQVGIMFLNEVVLGKEHHILRDDSSLTKPPSGFDCVIAKGNTEPDSKKDTKLKLDGKDVIVPQGKPISTGLHSSFSQSEYLIYKESQCRIRYLLQMKFN